MMVNNINEWYLNRLNNSYREAKYKKEKNKATLKIVTITSVIATIFSFIYYYEYLMYVGMLIHLILSIELTLALFAFNEELLLLLFYIFKKLNVPILKYQYALFKTRKKLEYIISSNNLYEVIDKENNIIDSILLKYKYNDNKLIIVIENKGSNWTEKVNNKNFFDLVAKAFGMLIYEVDKSIPQETKIVLLTSLPEPLNAKKAIYKNNDEIIPLYSNDIQIDLIDNPHWLIAGASGGGKTMLSYYFINSFLKINYDVYIFDGKGSELSNFRFFIGENKVFYEKEDMINGLKEIEKIMTARYDEIKSFSSNTLLGEYHFFPLVIVFDEVSSFILSLDKQNRKIVEDILSRISMMGRQARIHLVFSTQRIESEILPNRIKNNISARILLGRSDNISAKLALGDIEIPDNYDSTTGNGLIIKNGISNVMPFMSPRFKGIEEVQEILEVIVNKN